MSYEYQTNYSAASSPLLANQMTQIVTNPTLQYSQQVSPLTSNIQYSQVVTPTNTIQNIQGVPQLAHLRTSNNTIQYTQVGTPYVNHIQYQQVGTPTNSIQYTQVGTPIMNASYVTVPQVNGPIYQPGMQIVSPIMSNIIYFNNGGVTATSPYNVVSMNGQQLQPAAAVAATTPSPKIVSEDMAKKYTIVGYNLSPSTKPTGRDNKAGWYGIHDKHVLIASQKQANVLLCGDSIIAGLSRYSSIWSRHFKPLNTVNCGIGGDRTQHVLWRMEKMTLPASVKYVVIHCGTNNIDRDYPQEIANGVMSCGLVLQESRPDLKIVITGLLPRDLQNSRRRIKIIETNKFLKKYCKQFMNFTYMEQDSDWVLADGVLNEHLYYSDHLHLVEKGNNKFATSITNTLIKIANNEEINYSSDEEGVNGSFERIKSEVRQSPIVEDVESVDTSGGSKKKRKRSLENSDGTPGSSSGNKRKKVDETISNLNGDDISSNMTNTPTKANETPKTKNVVKDYFSLDNTTMNGFSKQNGIKRLSTSPVVITIKESPDEKRKSNSSHQKVPKSTSAPSALVLKIKKSMAQARMELTKKKFTVSLQGYDSHGDSSSQGESTPPQVSKKLISDYGSSSDTE